MKQEALTNVSHLKISNCN